MYAKDLSYYVGLAAEARVQAENVVGIAVSLHQELSRRGINDPDLRVRTEAVAKALNEVLDLGDEIEATAALIRSLVDEMYQVARQMEGNHDPIECTGLLNRIYGALSKMHSLEARIKAIVRTR